MLDVALKQDDRGSLQNLYRHNREVYCQTLIAMLGIVGNDRSATPDMCRHCSYNPPLFQTLFNGTIARDLKKYLMVSELVQVRKGCGDRQR